MKTTCANDIMKNLEKASERLIQSSVKNSAKAVDNWTRFDKEPKRITVDGKEAMLV